MNFANRFGIAKRLHLVSLTVIAALLGLIFLAWMQLSEIGHLASEVSDNRAPQLERLTNVELSVTQVSLQLRHAMLVTTPADLASTLAYIGDKRKYIEQVLQELSKNAVSAEDRADAAKIIERGTGFWAVGEPNIALIQAGKKDEARMLTKTRGCEPASMSAPRRKLHARALLRPARPSQPSTSQALFHARHLDHEFPD